MVPVWTLSLMPLRSGSTEGLPATAYRKPRRTYLVARRALRAPTYGTIDDALASYEPTMLERVRGAIAEASPPPTTSSLPPVRVPCSQITGGETIWARPRRFEPFDRWQRVGPTIQRRGWPMRFRRTPRRRMCWCPGRIDVRRCEVGRASVELYVAIRHDDELRQHMLRIQHDLTQDVLAIAARLIEPRTSPDRLASTFWMTVNLVRGTVVDDMLGRNPQHRKEILARWTDLAGVALTGP